MKMIRIGLFGFGVVGEGIYKVLNEKPQLNCMISKVCIKHPDKPRHAPNNIFTSDPDVILEDPLIDVVVELIDDSEAAFKIVSQAMRNSKSVVSANKKMIAEHHKDLIRLQKKYNVSFLYEAAVCGSIPILRNLEEYFDNDLLNSVSGIVNGSTNFILSMMKDEGKTFEQALRLAQEQGIAETDPTLDVEGMDASYKLSIITLHAFGKLVNPETIVRKGIDTLHPFDFQYAHEKKQVIKLLATSFFDSKTNSASTSVLPTFLDEKNKLSQVNQEFNGVLIGSSLADEQFFYGKGAGRYPTSSAVLSDISSLRYNYRYEYKKGVSNGVYRDSKRKGKFYISFGRGHEPDENIFNSIEEKYFNRHRNFIVGEIKFDTLLRNDFWKKKEVSLIQFE